MKKKIIFILVLIVGIAVGIVLSDKIPQKEIWSKDGTTKLVICNFYQKPVCTEWVKETFDTPYGQGGFSSCQGWSCYKNYSNQ